MDGDGAFCFPATCRDSYFSSMDPLSRQRLSPFFKRSIRAAGVCRSGLWSLLKIRVVGGAGAAVGKRNSERRSVDPASSVLYGEDGLQIVDAKRVERPPPGGDVPFFIERAQALGEGLQGHGAQMAGVDGVLARSKSSRWWERGWLWQIFNLQPRVSVSLYGAQFGVTKMNYWNTLPRSSRVPPTEGFWSNCKLLDYRVRTLAVPRRGADLMLVRHAWGPEIGS
ncbi:hypothetical protein QBC42DRAFT_348406 [Cladorrhinum samala]|uniref:Uncharacterized protein n=1 Tax=Cladorrhinum samala TaxID=585594 RepID=A0AAV9HIW2_9PEZI|nr:hypothetical protein QBC42DRAFT_348406 [Cladorrhinum samala]